MSDVIEGPKVAIIMPTYKRNADSVVLSIKSVLNQTYQNIELWLIDDNGIRESSSLESYRLEISKMVQELDSEKIVYIKNEHNIGGALARNVGIFSTDCEYITFLDDDDRYLPQKVESQLKHMLCNNLDVSFTDLGLYDEEDKLTDYREYSKIKHFDTQSLLRYHLTRQITGTPTFMCKKSVLTTIGGFDDACMGQEYYLMFKIISSGCSIGYIPHSDVVAYRTAKEAISNGPNKIKGEMLLYTFKRSKFDILSGSERRFVRFRHYVIMCVASLRRKKYLSATKYICIAFIASPLDAFAEAFGFFQRRIKNIESTRDG
ncbi:MAG: glycosyltransferase [Christensenellaceae bacterium]|nr:glycosyltransferase [Christensenellaceae bacterium]